MKIVETIREMQRTADEIRLQGKKIGVVPTMGYLHEGHLSLIRIAKQHADVIITTIFVNPTQFAPGEDFEKYPRDLEHDKRLAESAEADILFIPTTQEMYPDDYLTFVEVEKLTKVLEGKSRPTHFRGVTTVVAKLLNITKPHAAVFGQKDAQQAIIIQRMIKDLNFDIEVIVAPLVRENDGLAVSSRNVYLSPSERGENAVLFQSLQLAKQLIKQGERRCTTILAEMTQLINSRPSAHIDYVSLADPTTLQELSTLQDHDTVLVSMAVRIGATRLIDNVVVIV